MHVSRFRFSHFVRSNILPTVLFSLRWSTETDKQSVPSFHMRNREWTCSSSFQYEGGGYRQWKSSLGQHDQPSDMSSQRPSLMIMVFNLGYNPAKHVKRLQQNKLDVIKKQFRKLSLSICSTVKLRYNIQQAGKLANIRWIGMPGHGTPGTKYATSITFPPVLITYRNVIIRLHNC